MQPILGRSEYCDLLRLMLPAERVMSNSCGSVCKIRITLNKYPRCIPEVEDTPLKGEFDKDSRAPTNYDYSYGARRSWRKKMSIHHT